MSGMVRSFGTHIQQDTRVGNIRVFGLPHPDRFTDDADDEVVFLALYFVLLWAAWVFSVWVTEPKKTAALAITLPYQK